MLLTSLFFVAKKSLLYVLSTRPAFLRLASLNIFSYLRCCILGLCPQIFQLIKHDSPLLGYPFFFQLSGGNKVETFPPKFLDILRNYFEKHPNLKDK